MVKLARIPTQVARGGVAARPLDFTPLAQGFAQVGSALKEVADRQQRSMDHAAAILFEQGRREAIASALDEAKALAGPAGKGYAEAAQKLYRERVSKLLPGLPEGISIEARQRFETELESGAGVVGGAAREYVLGAERAYQVQAFEAVRSDALKAIMADPASYAQGVSKMEATIDTLTGGAFTPEQALELKRKLRSEAAETATGALIDKDAEDIAEEAIGPKGRFTRDLDPQGLAAARKKIDAKREQRRIERDRADREAERALKKRREDAEKEYFDKLSSGALTEQDLASAKRDLEPSAYRSLSDAFRRGDGRDDPNVVKGLTDKIHGQGANAKEDIRAAHQNGRLSNETATKLYKENDSAKAEGLSSEAKSELQFLRNAVTPSEFTGPTISSEDRAVMLREAEAYAREKPRTAKELREYSNTLLQLYYPQALQAKRPSDARTLPIISNPPPITGDGFTRPKPASAKDLGIAPAIPPAKPNAMPAAQAPAKPVAAQVQPSALPNAPAALAKPFAQRTPEERSQIRRWIGLTMIRKHGGNVEKIKADPAYQRVLRENGDPQ